MLIPTRRHAAVALVFTALASAQPRAQTGAPGPTVGGRCQSAVDQQLRQWSVVAPPRRQPGTADGGMVRHWPTAVLGTWVVELGQTGSASLVRTEPARTTRVEWSASCVATVTIADRRRLPAPRFDDDDLQRLVAAHGRGVIYLWSPHMPLSIDGFRSVRAAAEARGLLVQAVLDPAADRAFAAASLTAAGLPVSALRVADAVELLFRDVTLHAPTIQAFGGGALRGSAFPGYHSAEEYGAFLDRVLAPAPPRHDR